jgi:[CysO sulfur-carrier protein]-S-L-cysteine hydrolase
VIACPEGTDRPERFIPLRNVATSPETFHDLDSDEKFKVWNEMWERDEEAVVLYHSHSMTEAYPSRSDIDTASFAGEPNAHYVVVSTREANTAEFRSYRILDGEVTEEPVTIVE